MTHETTNFAQAVQAAIAASVAPKHAPTLLSVGVSHLARASGKRLRPQLIHWIGTDLGASEQDLISIAVAAELIHTASLLHDDVVDTAYERRGARSTNAVVGNAAAVLSGDWILAEALFLLRTTPNAVRDGASEVVRRMAHAAVWEVEWLGSTDRSMDDWRRVARGKTGALFGWCATSAAMVANRGDFAPALLQWGEMLGTTFQRADDLQDVLSDNSGKPRFADLRNRNLSSTIVALCAAEPTFRTALENLWARPHVSEDEVVRLGHWLANADSTQQELAHLAEEIQWLETQAAACLSPEACARLRAKLGAMLTPPSVALKRAANGVMVETMNTESNVTHSAKSSEQA